MDTITPDLPNEPVAETPEDVAILYSWANLHGAKYRDFSASRREYRAQVRHRAAEDLRQAELQAQADAESAAAEAERVAREAERAARTAETYDSSIDRERALREAEEAARRAAAERVEAARRAESAAMAEALARKEEREIAEAHASAQRQAARWADSDVRRRALAGPQPARMPGLASDPYEAAQGPGVDMGLPTQNRQIEYTQPGRSRDDYDAQQQQLSASGERRAYRPPPVESRRRPQGFRPDVASGVRPAFREPVEQAPVRARIHSGEDRLAAGNPERFAAPSGRTSAQFDRAFGQDRGFGVERGPERYPERYPERMQDRGDRPGPERAGFDRDRFDRAGLDSGSDRASYRGLSERPAPDRTGADRAGFERGSSAMRSAFDRSYSSSRPFASTETARSDSPLDRESTAPAWLYSSGPGTQPSQPNSSVADTLQHSRERVAARWYALKGVFEPDQEPIDQMRPGRPAELRTPVLAVFALTGGVGKTSLVATLGRALSAAGEKVLLADMTSHGLLPYYFGASELRPGVVRTFSPPSGSADAAIYMVSYEVEGRAQDRAMQETLAEELLRSAIGTQRILLDLNASSGWVLKRLARMSPTVLVPVAPDMNSVISLQAVEKYFAGATDGEGRAIQPFYILNQFDSSLPLHLDVREVLRRQLGDRLLPFVVRRAPAVSEALAEGMTVVDYVPEAPIAEDYRAIAQWVRTLAAPPTQATRNARWSER